MPWQGIVGHDDVLARFRRAMKRNRLASSFLFVGPAGIGKRTFALRLAQGLLCDRVPPEHLEPCGICAACQQVQALSHPDVDLIVKPEDKATIPLELLIGDDEHRMRAGLCYNLSTRPFSGKRKVAIIDDADYFNREGANCLLKTLEEPPAGALLILIGTSQQRQLPTIRSRCQVVRFRPLTTQQVATLLQAQLGEASTVDIAALAARSDGSLTRARELLDDSWAPLRDELLDALAQPEWDQLSLVRQASSAVDNAGKEGAAKRARLRQIVGVAIDFYHALLEQLVRGERDATSRVARAAASASRWWRGHTEAVSVCLETCFDMLAAIDSNANAANVLECWFDELATIARTGRSVR
jgi:DNA polymerase-3 subunit delta'